MLLNVCFIEPVEECIGQLEAVCHQGVAEDEVSYVQEVPNGTLTCPLKTGYSGSSIEVEQLPPTLRINMMKKTRLTL